MPQASGLVPIVEPEVLLDGEHDIDRTLEVAEAIWAETFKYLADNKVRLPLPHMHPALLPFCHVTENRELFSAVYASVLVLATKGYMHAYISKSLREH